MSTKKNKNQPEKVGMLLLIISLSIATILYLLGRLNINKIVQKTAPSSTNNIDLASKENWLTYVSNTWGYSLEYPRYLLKQEINTNERYLNFVVFQKTEYTNYSGVAVGVDKLSLTDEVEKIKKDILDSDGVSPSNEKDVYLNNLAAKRLDYKARNKDQEDKTIIIVNDGTFTYSVSTTPNQIGDIIKHFELLGSYGFCNNPDINNPTNRYISSYCSGYYCNLKKTQTSCESTDVIAIQNDSPLDKQSKDGTSDCKWVTEGDSATCKPFF